MGKASARKRLRQKGAPSSLASKGAFGTGIWSHVALGVVALMLMAVSLGLLVFGVVPVAYDWSRMRHWQPVSAQVEFAEVQKRGTARGGSEYTTLVRYRYAVTGMPYTGTRALVGPAGDGWSRFHHRFAERLQTAQRTGAPVQVWVNPQKPAESVVDRKMRFGPLLGDLAMAVFAGGGGVVLMILVVGELRQRRRSKAQPTGRAKNAS